MRTHKQKIGALGERIAGRNLEEKGMKVIGRNYRKPWGEIDLIVEDGSLTRFVEVKTVTRDLTSEIWHEYRAEDNIHPWKIQRLERAIASYCQEYGVGGEWTLTVAVVYLDMSHRKASVSFIEDIF